MTKELIEIVNQCTESCNQLLEKLNTCDKTDSCCFVELDNCIDSCSKFIEKSKGHLTNCNDEDCLTGCNYAVGIAQDCIDACTKLKACCNTNNISCENLRQNCIKAVKNCAQAVQSCRDCLKSE